jgi:DNA-binding transcriptional MerR regulator
MPTEPIMLPKLAERARLKYGTLRLWVKRGLIVPSIRPEEGSGRPGLYSERDACLAEGLAHLSRAGVDFPTLQTIALTWRKHNYLPCPVCGTKLDLADFSAKGTGDAH